jgi:hypothetical protein
VSTTCPYRAILLGTMSVAKRARPGGNVKLRLGVTLLVLAVLLVGCSGVPIPPTSSKDELRTTCQRQGGWWRGDYCERDSHR